MKALDRLGISDCFEQIICFETLNPNLPNSTRPDQHPILLKPSLDAFKIAIDAANLDPHRTVSSKINLIISMNNLLKLIKFLEKN